MNHTTWYERITGNATERAVSLASGITTSTLNRQLAKGVLSPENVIAISRAYGVSPIQGLVSTEYLKPEEVSDMSEEQMADSLSDRILIQTLAKRLGEDPEELMNEAEESLTSNVRRLPQPIEQSESEPEPERYVAKRKKPEPGEGDDDYGAGA
ncbi:hypothetical protein SFC07_11180 [Corynebacterium callunae]|uniref:hypothetical protein n=1 Tax=Corynebacterium callunae TaxID=1721 RepID=UPI003981E820